MTFTDMRWLNAISFFKGVLFQFLIVRIFFSNDTISVGANSALGKSTNCPEEEWISRPWNEEILQVTDGNPETCQRINFEREAKLATTFHGKPNITYIDIYMKNLTEEVEIHLQCNSVSNRKFCVLDKSGNDTELKRFRCDVISVKEIQLSFMSKEQMELILCEVTAVSYSERTCGVPAVNRFCESVVRGNTVQYKPFHGFTVSTLDRIRTCENGKWSGNPPKCENKGPKITSCGSPEIPGNGRLDSAVHSVKTYSNSGDLAVFICDYGYLLNGPKNSSCTDGIWDNNQRYCDRNLMLNQYFWFSIKFTNTTPCLQTQVTDEIFSNTSNSSPNLTNQRSILINFNEIDNIEKIIISMNLINKNNVPLKNRNLFIDMEIGNQTNNQQIIFERFTSLNYSVESWLNETIKCPKMSAIGNIVRINFTADEYIFIHLWEVQVHSSSSYYKAVYTPNTTKQMTSKVNDKMLSAEYLPLMIIIVVLSVLFISAVAYLIIKKRKYKERLKTNECEELRKDNTCTKL